MNRCVCGKGFENRISCSRHQSTCAVYRKSQVVEKKSFLKEGQDHVVCRYCGYKARDITKHLSTARLPHPDRKVYREMFPDQKLVCSDVELSRKSTNRVLHGNENYRNPEAQRRGILRAMKEKDVVNRVRRTKKERYGDPGYVNVEKRKRTLLERYGVDNAMKNPDVMRKALKTRKVLYGDNPIHREPLLPKEELIQRHHTKGQTLEEIASDFSVTPEAISYWMKKFGVKVHKRVVVPLEKKYVPPADTARNYLEECLSAGSVLSFSSYGRRTEDKRKSRLKRLFNAGKPFHHMKKELKDVALDPLRWDNFLSKLYPHDVLPRDMSK